jgi:hypothetical protein
MTVTVAAPVTATVAVTTLAELLERGYSLSVGTRVDVYNHKVGPHPVTYADRLLVSGDERVPGHLREAIVAHKPLLLAAACVLDPPTPWLRELVRRCRMAPYRTTPGVLAANIAAFVGLDPIDDTHGIEPVVRAALEKEGRDAH